MTNLSAGKIIFSYYLCKFKGAVIDILLSYCQKLPDRKTYNEIIRLCKMDEKELKHFIGYGADEDDFLMYMNIFLWKQKEKIFPINNKINYDFSDLYLTILSHRFMINAGYQGVEKMLFSQNDNSPTTHLTEISTYIDAFEKNISYEEPFFCWLFSNLYAVGPNIKENKDRKRIHFFYNYFLKNHNEPIFEGVRLFEFVYLCIDLESNLNTLWDPVQYYFKKNGIIWYDLPAYPILVNYFGDKFCSLVRNYLHDLDLELFKDLATCIDI